MSRSTQSAKSLSASDFTVLHVVDRGSGGVPTAVQTYIRNSDPRVRHIAILPVRDLAPDNEWQRLGVSTIDIGPGSVRRIRRVRSAVRAHQPQVIHCHSSFSGMYARLAVRKRVDLRIVYTPHCYAFERRDISIAIRGVFWLIELALGLNTSCVAACSAHEAKTVPALTAHGRASTIIVPNVADRPRLWSPPAPKKSDTLSVLQVGTSGRIAPQKDPSYFLRLMAELHQIGIPVKATWIGGGNDAATAALIDGGVSVSGWQLPDGVDQLMSELDLYLHTAAWEGFPISVLEAHCLDKPILVREIAAFKDLPEELMLTRGVPDLAEAVSSGEFAAWATTNIAQWSRYLSDNVADVQRERLMQAWTGGVA